MSVSLSSYDVNKVIRAQKVWRRFRKQKIPRAWHKLLREYAVTDEAKSARRRFKLWNEIISTERTYRTGLEFAITNYKPKLSESELVTVAELNMMFGNVQEMKNISEFILEQLVKQVLPTTSAAPLGRVFIKTLPFLKMYITYTVNFERFITVYGNLKQNKSFIDMEKDIASGQQHLNLGDLLITPVQRIPRYKMLFDQLVVLTPKDYQGYDELVQCNTEITTLCGTINESKKKGEAMHHLFRIQRVLTGNYGGLLGQGRQFLKEGPVQIHVRVKEVSSNFPAIFLSLSGEYYLFGFNDILIIAGPKDGKTCQFVCSLNLEQIQSINVIFEKAGALSFQMRVKPEDPTGATMYWLLGSTEEAQGWTDVMTTEHKKIEVTSNPDDDIEDIAAMLGPRIVIPADSKLTKTGTTRTRTLSTKRSSLRLFSSTDKDKNSRSLKPGLFSPPEETMSNESSPEVPRHSPILPPASPVTQKKRSLSSKLSKLFT